MIKGYIKRSVETKNAIINSDILVNKIKTAGDIIVKSYREGGKVLIAGNGGSASDAQHMSGELVSRFFYDRPALAAIALTTDTSIITAIGNDYGYEDIFSRQIEANGTKGDVFIAISTSGNSKNILKALTAAKNKGIKTVGLTGAKTCSMDSMTDLCIKVPSEITPHIQEAHITIIHILCAYAEEVIHPLVQ